MPKGDVGCLNVADGWCRIAARIGKAQHPFHRSEFRPARHLALHLQPRLAVCVGGHIAQLVLLCAGQARQAVPASPQQVFRGHSAVLERERRCLPLAELRRYPALHLDRLAVLDGRPLSCCSHREKEKRYEQSKLPAQSAYLPI